MLTLTSLRLRQKSWLDEFLRTDVPYTGRHGSLSYTEVGANYASSVTAVGSKKLKSGWPHVPKGRNSIQPDNSGQQSFPLTSHIFIDSWTDYK